MMTLYADALRHRGHRAPPLAVAGLLRHARIAATVATLLIATACRGGDTDAARRDDLTRDLSLAAAATASALEAFGDTAVGAPMSPPAPEPEPAPAPTPPPERAPAPVVAPQRTPPPRPAPRAPADVAAPAPDVAADPLPATVPASAPAATPAPAPVPAPAPRTLLAAGTVLAGTTGTRLCTTTNRPGDRLVMRLTDDVVGPDGSRVAAGTSVLLEVASADSVVTLRVRAIQHNGDLLPLSATAAVDGPMEGSRVANGSDAKKVVGGAIAGAIIGQILGKDTRSTVVGAAGGAAAGAMAAQRGGSSERCLPAGAAVRVVLNAPLLLPGTGP